MIADTALSDYVEGDYMNNVSALVITKAQLKLESTSGLHQ